MQYRDLRGLGWGLALAVPTQHIKMDFTSEKGVFGNISRNIQPPGTIYSSF